MIFNFSDYLFKLAFKRFTVMYQVGILPKLPYVFFFVFDIRWILLLSHWEMGNLIDLTVNNHMYKRYKMHLLFSVYTHPTMF